MNLGIVIGLIGVPLVSAVALLCARADRSRAAVVTVSTVALVAGPLALASLHLPDRDILLHVPLEYASYAILVERKQARGTINRLRCIGCNYCVEVCPPQCLSMLPHYSSPTVTRDREITAVPRREKNPEKGPTPA